MNYLIIANLNRHDNYYTFVTGESLTDPNLVEQVLKWLSGFHDGDYAWEDDIEDRKENRENIEDRYGIKAYEVSERPELIPDIWPNLEIYLNKRHEKRIKNQEEMDKQNRKATYERLRKEFENQT